VPCGVAETRLCEVPSRKRRPRSPSAALSMTRPQPLRSSDGTRARASHRIHPRTLAHTHTPRTLPRLSFSFFTSHCLVWGSVAVASSDFVVVSFYSSSSFSVPPCFSSACGCLFVFVHVCVSLSLFFSRARSGVLSLGCGFVRLGRWSLACAQVALRLAKDPRFQRLPCTHKVRTHAYSSCGVFVFLTSLITQSSTFLKKKL
jgi:hypothetical protein